MSKSNQIRDLLKANPEMPVAAVAATVGCNSALVYQVKAAIKKEAGAAETTAVKRGRPAKTKDATPTEGQIVLREVIKRDDHTVQALKEEIKGYRTVISYLEHQLGLKDSQRGATV